MIGGRLVLHTFLPQCGTTWSQELIWQVAHGVDLEGGRRDLNERFPFLELDTLLDLKLIIPNIFLRCQQYHLPVITLLLQVHF